MTRKITFYLDSGANSHSCYEQTLSLEELDLTEEEWENMPEEEKTEMAREIAWDRMDWGWYEND